MKKFVPGERVIPYFAYDVVRKGKNVHVYVLKNKNGYVRRRWWGVIQFTDNKTLATKWFNINEARLWAREKGLY